MHFYTEVLFKSCWQLIRKLPGSTHFFVLNILKNILQQNKILLQHIKIIIL